MSINQRTFGDVLHTVGSKPPEAASQNATRHYSETLSREIAIWIREKVIVEFEEAEVLLPEGKVNTIYGVGNRGKSLDVGVLNSRKYLLLDISIKTFNFKDRKTNNYRHNYTGRFYELLGEDLDIRRSYPHATLVALIFLPEDSIQDSIPSSFAHCVRQFSKIAKRGLAESELGFEFVFVGIHNESGDLYFFNSTASPNRNGHPPQSSRLSIDDVLQMIRQSVDSRLRLIDNASLPEYVPYIYLDHH